MDNLKDVVFYLCISAFVAVCLLKPNLILGFRKKDGNDKSKEDAKKQGGGLMGAALEAIFILAIFGLIAWVMSPKHPERIENLRKKIFRR